MTSKTVGCTIRSTTILLGLFLIGGCAHTWSPSSVSSVPMETVGPLGQGLSVHFVNNQPLTSPQLFFTDVGHTHHANYNEWTEFFIQYWGRELTKRGVAVGPQSPNTIFVKLDEFFAHHYFAVYVAGMRINLSNPENTWRKELIETNSTVMGSLPGTLSNAVRLSVEKLLQNTEVLDRMKQ
jgi:uncharacterized lipoprotein YajG